MNVDALFTDDGLREFTDIERDQHMEAGRQYGQIGQIIQGRLKQTPIEGDRPFAAGRRARKVARKMKRMQRASEKAAASAEALYATYKHHVLELPERRAVTAERKAARKQQRAVAKGAFVAKSLDKSTRFLAGDAANPQASGGQQQEPQYLDAPSMGFGRAAGGEDWSPEGIGEFFAKGQR
jgi:hypothetical protein